MANVEGARISQLDRWRRVYASRALLLVVRRNDLAAGDFERAYRHGVRHNFRNTLLPHPPHSERPILWDVPPFWRVYRGLWRDSSTRCCDYLEAHLLVRWRSARDHGGRIGGNGNPSGTAGAKGGRACGF